MLHSQRAKRAVSATLYIVICIVLLIFFIAPLWSTFIGGFSTYEEVMTGRFHMLPSPFQWNFPRLLEMTMYPPFFTMVKNSLILTLTAVPTVLFSAVTAFGLSRFRGYGQNVIFMVLMSTMMLPGIVTMIPTFIMFKNFGWIDTFFPFFVPTIGGNIGFVFLMRQFMRSIPKDFDEAAEVDGANYFRIFWKIILPMSKPVLAVTFIQAVIGAWNNFFGPLIYFNKTEMYPLALGVNLLRNFSVVRQEWNVILFAIFLSTLPMILIFFFFQRYIVEGVVISGIKG
ncbi:MAG: carbohydrate ABC transporter permease [Oscillospiraceae bacterium]|jgi:ABC-type glycerol-3-phosphate transport system permease component|nr:carbohydrate ABC transporter permease [Oscillospiraceae bacterium]